jgi:hypothetical protein
MDEEEMETGAEMGDSRVKVEKKIRNGGTGVGDTRVKV